MSPNLRLSKTLTPSNLPTYFPVTVLSPMVKSEGRHPEHEYAPSGRVPPYPSNSLFPYPRHQHRPPGLLLRHRTTHRSLPTSVHQEGFCLNSSLPPASCQRRTPVRPQARRSHQTLHPPKSLWMTRRPTYRQLLAKNCRPSWLRSRRPPRRLPQRQQLPP